MCYTLRCGEIFADFLGMGDFGRCGGGIEKQVYYTQRSVEIARSGWCSAGVGSLTRI